MPTPLDGSGKVVVMAELLDRSAADAFRTDPTAGPVMRKGGAQGPPSATYLEQIGSFDH